MTEITIKSNNKTLIVPKEQLLSIKSSYFSALFNGKYKDQTEIILNEINLSDLLQIIDNNVNNSLITTMNFLGIDPDDDCCLQDRILYYKDDKNKLVELVNTCKDFIDNYDVIKDYPYETLIKIIDNIDVNYYEENEYVENNLCLGSYDGFKILINITDNTNYKIEADFRDFEEECKIDNKYMPKYYLPYLLIMNKDYKLLNYILDKIYLDIFLKIDPGDGDFSELLFSGETWYTDIGIESANNGIYSNVLLKIFEEEFIEIIDFIDINKLFRFYNKWKYNINHILTYAKNQDKSVIYAINKKLDDNIDKIDNISREECEEISIIASADYEIE